MGLKAVGDKPGAGGARGAKLGPGLPGGGAGVRGDVSQENGRILLDDVPGRRQVSDSPAILWTTGSFGAGAGRARHAFPQPGAIDGGAGESANVPRNEAGADASAEVVSAAGVAGAEQLSRDVV